jgi:NADH:ubiquinone oxidoreductase subunit 6 (subunit J)
MITEIVALLAALLVVATAVALLIQRLVYSLISLFYASLLMGAIFLAYGASYAGLFQIITFSGAVSVMFMVILMLVGREPVPAGPRFSPERVVGYVLAIAGFLVFAAILSQFAPLAIHLDEGQATRGVGLLANDPLAFLWTLRSWDALFLIILVSATIAGILNFFSKEVGHE